MFQAVIAAMPPHDTYIETHLGSGVVMRAKPAAARQIGVEIDPRVLALFEMQGGFEDVTEADVERWLRQVGEHHLHHMLVLEDVRQPAPCELVLADAVLYLEKFDFASAGRVLVYADPPYVAATRTAFDRHQYAHEMSDDDHRRLIATLRDLPAAVMISGYPSALYDELLGDWRVIRFQAMTRGGPRTEELRLNFPAGEVQWATFAGPNFTRRQNIKRKAARWKRMYAAMSPGERLAVLAALLEVPAGEPPAAMVDRHRALR